MVVQIQKWGNSLAVRIPKAYAMELGLERGSDVDIVVEDGEVHIRPVAVRPQLSDLVRRITRSNIHGEIDYGSAQGNEAW